MAVCATVVPFIYLFIQKRAEDRLLHEQRAYQATLQRASAGMGQVKDLRKLVSLIVHVVTRAVKIEYCSIYLLHEESHQYVLKAVKNGAPRAMPADPSSPNSFRVGLRRVYPSSQPTRAESGVAVHESSTAKTDKDNTDSIIAIDSALIKYLKEHKEALVYEEIKQRAQDYADEELSEIEKIMGSLDAALMVPSFIEQSLIAIIVLGKKLSGKIYNQDDLTVFLIFANQTGLAIGNLKSVEAMKKAQEKLFHAEKLAYLGQLASSVVHEVRNPITAIKTFVEYLPEKFRSQDMDFLQRFERIVPAEVERIENLVRELLDLARPRQMKKNEIRISAVVNTTLDLLKDNFQLRGIRLEKEYLTQEDRILGDAEQIQQVLLNLILNAMDAMLEGGLLNVRISRENNRIVTSVRDTGCGISADDLKRLFTPFYTTKKKGVGLGLIVTQEIVKMHGGEIQVESQPGKGTQFSVILPALSA